MFDPISLDAHAGRLAAAGVTAERHPRVERGVWG
jgi:hypothetical protein